jgi:hypothetical protein
MWRKEVEIKGKEARDRDRWRLGYGGEEEKRAIPPTR